MRNSSTQWNRIARNCAISLIKLFLMFCIFHTLASSVQAATYYVSKTGNDTTGTGSSGNPWLTLQKAETAATTGDTVNVSVGTYVEDDATTHGWNVTKGITWVATGSVIVRGTGASTRPLYTSGTNTISFTGFTFDAEGTRTHAVNIAAGAGNKSFTSCIFKDGTGDLLGVNGNVTNITIISSTFTMSAASSYGITATSGGINSLSVTNSTINGNTGTAFLRMSTYSSTVTIQNNTFNMSGALYAFYVNAPGTYTISNNTFSYTSANISSVGYFLGSVTATLNFQNNTLAFDSSARSAGPDIDISGGPFTTTITGNSFTSTNTTQTQPVISVADQTSPIVNNNTIDYLATAIDPLIKVTSTGVDGGVVQVKANILKSRSANGHVILIGSEGTTTGDGKLNGAIIEGNTIYGPYYYNPSLVSGSINHSIFYGYNVNGSIRFNTVIGGGYGVVVKGLGTSYISGGIFYNKFINCLGGATIRIKGVSNINVMHNTIYDDASTTGVYTGLYITQNNIGENSTGVTARNNIFQGVGTGSFMHFIDSSSTTGLNVDYNSYYLPSSSNMLANYNSTNYTFSTWQGLGFDTHGKYEDPLFINPASYNFNLSYNSSAIDAGLTTAFTTDFTGNPIYGSPDMGALEYQPPYIMGTDLIDINGNIRLYGDGHFRNTTTALGTTADYNIAPVGGFSGSDYTEKLNLSVSTWNTSGLYQKQFSETSSSLGSTSTIHTIGNFSPNKPYYVFVNSVLGQNISGASCTAGVCQSDGSGRISYTYSGGYSSPVAYSISGPTDTPTPTPTAQPSGSPILTPVTNTPAPSTNTATNSNTPPNCPAGYVYCIDAGPNQKTDSAFVSNSLSAPGISVFIGKEASKDDVHVVMSEPSLDSLTQREEPVPFPWAQCLNVGSEIVEIKTLSAFNGYPILTLDQPGTIILPYDEEKVKNVPLSKLRIAWYNTSTKKWNVIEGNTVLDTQKKTIANTTRQMATYFAVVYPSSTCASAADNGAQNTVSKTQKKGSSKSTATPVPTQKPKARQTPALKRKASTPVPQKTCFLFFCQ